MKTPHAIILAITFGGAALSVQAQVADARIKIEAAVFKGTVSMGISQVTAGEIGAVSNVKSDPQALPKAQRLFEAFLRDNTMASGTASRGTAPRVIEKTEVLRLLTSGQLDPVLARIIMRRSTFVSSWTPVLTSARAVVNLEQDGSLRQQWLQRIDTLLAALSKLNPPGPDFNSACFAVRQQLLAMFPEHKAAFEPAAAKKP